MGRKSQLSVRKISVFPPMKRVMIHVYSFFLFYFCCNSVIFLFRSYLFTVEKVACRCHFLLSDYFGRILVIVYVMEVACTPFWNTLFMFLWCSATECLKHTPFIFATSVCPCIHIKQLEEYHV